MGILGSVVLLILGMLAAQEVIVRLWPGLRPYLHPLAALSGPLGVGAALYGCYLTLYMLAYLGFVRYAPLVYLVGLLGGLTSMALGLLFGRRTAQGWLAGRSAQLLSRAEPLERLLSRHRTELGLAGVLLGALGLALHLFV
ncbi:MAG: hypothetical protein NZ890_09715 [Myxococcota bacterium]|nr:hypothetical protein [Myxococcota bacterium]